MEIEKEKRLPEWYNSWTELAEDLQSQDALALKHNGEPVRRMGFVPVFPGTPDRIHETFESDVASIKIRAFDELNEVLPGKAKLFRMIEELYAFPQYRGRDGELASFLKDLMQLYTPRP